MQKSRLNRQRQLRRRFLSQRSTLRVEALEPRRLMVGDITGSVFLDTNLNGIDDPAENGLPDWTVFVDSNGDGTLSVGEPSAVTDANGRYALTGLPAGPMQLYEVLQPGYSPTPGFSDHQSVTVRDGREVRAKFPNYSAPVTTGQVIGTVFEDDNENGVKDPGEHGITGWTMFIDANGDGSLTAGELSATTDTDGDYRILDVPAGNATVYEIPAGGLRPIVGGLFPLEGASDHRAVSVVAGSSVRADFANLTPPVGTIQGNVWNDADGDGQHAASEAGVAGRTVFIDLNLNGSPDPTEPVRVTDANGAYAFVQIHTGTYRVIEQLAEGWITADGRSAVVNVTVSIGSNLQIDYFNLVPTVGSISGQLWDDANGNGVINAGEAGLAGWPVYLDLNKNGSLDAGDPQTVTSSDGSYTIPNVAYGYATIGDVVPANWVATNPTAAAQTIHLLNGQNRTGVNFGNREKVGTIQGLVWNDANGDRVRAATEGGLADWTVFLDLNSDGALSADEPAATTNATGNYTFNRVPNGTYRVTEVVPEGWITSIGKSTFVSVTVTTGSTSTADYYNLVPVDGSISGTVYSDLDSNGARGAAEPGLVGWQVFADLNANGRLDADEPSATSDDTGAYTLTGMHYGNNVLQEVIQPGYSATSPVTGRQTVSLLNGENRTGVLFGNHELTEFTISGTAFFDANGNSVRDADERGLSGISVYLDTNDNGILDAGEPSTLTSSDLYFTPAVNEAGNYAFTHLARGTYRVRELLPAELSATPDANRSQQVTIGTANVTADFANVFRLNEIHGVAFDDTDADHVRDPGEFARPGISVYIDLNRNDSFDLDEPTTVTAADGSYAFVDLQPGAYIVRETPGQGPITYPQTGGGILWPAGESHAAIGQVTPTSITTSLASGDSYQQTVTLTLPGGGGITNLVDVFLLFDDTGSFTANSPIVRAAFPQIIASLSASLPGIDLGFGVGRFEEYGSFAGEFATGRPFILNQPIVAASTPNFSASIQSALDRMAPGFGGDGPETDIEGLYQLVTGLGFDGNNNGTTLDSGSAGLASTQLTPGSSGDVPAFSSFTPDPAHNVLPAAGSIGGAGFRPGALPIILTATDIGFAYQPKGETSVTGVGGLSLPVSALTQTSRPTTPFSSGAGLQETVTGLNALGALVIGLGTNPGPTIDPRQGLESLALLTGAINRSSTTVANGTADPIAPGDPFYFQISDGFGTTVADGVLNAIQNAVTNVAVDITLRASDPRVRIINHSGTQFGIGSGQTASFDVEFVGDGRPHRFDLQFIREGTNVVLGSIPVVLGTPVLGDGYNYDELKDGEIHRSSHFGNYVANQAPTFTAGGDVSAAEDAGGQSIAGWATNISAGGVTESGQALNFIVSNDQPALFATPPAISPDGTLTFTPAANAVGSAVVTVQLHDDGGVGPGGADTSAPQAFTITLTPVNDAPLAVDDSFSTTEDVPLEVLAPGLLSNDTDIDGDSLTAELVDAPAHGSVVIGADGSFVYTPAAGYFGADSFTYRANDGALTSPLATVQISIAAANRPPVATGDAATTDEDTPLTVAAPGVLGNDTDAEGDALSAVLVDGPLHGSLTLNADGSFVYVPAANFNGSDFFTYRASDGIATSDLATVNVTVLPVNDAPVATHDSAAVDEDGTLNVAAPGVLTNDVDVDGDALTVELIDGPLHGSLTLNADGSFSYVPAANFHGSDRFTYRASDATLASNVATVNITVNSVNDAPVAVDESLTTAEDVTLSSAVPGVLGNDTDVDGDSLSAVLVSGPAHGTLTLNANGALVYVPSANFNGTDRITYRASDGSLTSNIATVNITVTPVNDAPVAASDSYSTAHNTPLTSPARGVLVNDTDVDGDPLTAVLATGPAHGTLTLSADGAFVYTPTTGYFGTDSFTYRASDGAASSSLTTVTITVAAPAATKFFVVDVDAKSTYRYAADGASLGNNALNKSDSKPRGVAANPTGTTLWVIDGSGTVFVYDNTATLLGQWQPQNAGKPEGVTVWGNDLWLVDPTQDRVFFFAGGATARTGRINPTSSFPLNAGNLNSTDLVTDGSHLWVVNDTTSTDAVFRYTTAGVLEGSWTLPAVNSTPTGITLDPDHVNHLWIVDATTDRIYQYDAATTRLSGTQSASTSFVLAAGNGNAQGIADPRPSSPSGSLRGSKSESKSASSSTSSFEVAAQAAASGVEVRRESAEHHRSGAARGELRSSRSNDLFANFDAQVTPEIDDSLLSRRTERRSSDDRSHRELDAIFGALGGDDVSEHTVTRRTSRTSTNRRLS